MLYSCQEVGFTFALPPENGICNVLKRLKRVKEMNLSKYTIQELADILGVSVAAIRKKIYIDDKDPNIKRYKRRYPIVTETVDNRQVMQICLTDIELEDEKRQAEKNKIKHSVDNTYQETYTNNVQNDENIIDGEVLSHKSKPKSEISSEILLNLTERYNNDIKTYLERIAVAESKTLLLEDKANREGYYIQEIKDAKKQTRNVILYFSVTLAILIVLLTAVSATLINTLLHPVIIEKQTVIEKQIPQKIVAPATKSIKK